MIRDITTIGNLWPLCKTCKHIAQEHEEDGCVAWHIGQCPTCATQGVMIRCSCKEYNGPTHEEFRRDYLTPEEIAHYKVFQRQE